MSGRRRTEVAGFEVVDVLCLHCAQRRISQRKGEAELIVRHYARERGIEVADIAWKTPLTAASAALVHKVAPTGSGAPSVNCLGTS